MISSNPTSREIPQDSRTIRILAIDDEPAYTALLRATLEATGEFHVYATHSARDAIGRALELRPDFICLDFCMPFLDGGDVLASFKDNPVLDQIPVLFLSSLLSSREVPDEGFVINSGLPMMPKTFDPEHLKSYIKARVPA